MPRRTPDSRSPRRRSALAAALLAIAILVCPLLATSAAALGPPAPAAYRLGVFPYLPVLAIDRIFGPVAVQLSEDLGRPVNLRTKPTFEMFAEEMRKESYDIILVHPFFYIEAHDRYHYLPVARLADPLTAAILVNTDHPAATLADLRGGTIALPPALAAVSELVEGALIDVGLEPGRDVLLEHYRNKHSCLQAVAIGQADACGLPRFALLQVDPGNEYDLRTLFETRGIPSLVFAVHSRVPQVDRINLCKSIIAWPFTAKGRRILDGGSWTRFVPAADVDYDEVRRYASRLRDFAKR